MMKKVNNEGHRRIMLSERKDGRKEVVIGTRIVQSSACTINDTKMGKPLIALG